MYDFFNLRLPETFENEFRMNWQNDNPYNLRNSFDFEIPTSRYVYLDEHPLFNFPRILNSLPQNIKSIGCHMNFLKKVKQYLFSKEF